MNNLGINMKLRNKYGSPLMEKGFYFLQIIKKRYSNLEMFFVLLMEIFMD